MHDGAQGKVVSIDGKRVRKAGEMNGDNPIHIVSAWLAENEMTLGQFKVSEKTNEITAESSPKMQIPEKMFQSSMQNAPAATSWLVRAVAVGKK